MQTPSNSGLTIRYCALSLGALFLMLGLAGFVPTLVDTPSDASYAVSGYGYLFGIFPTNYFHNALGILSGLWGIAAFTSLSGAIVFNQIFSIVYVAHAILGLLPFTNTLFGTMPLYGNNVWFNLVLAGIAFYYGFIKPSELPIQAATGASPNFEVKS